ncbi:hypothetical protein [Streptomyces sp. AcE210]|uniref:hypothetical protein n=1 Tax=Streptomyces sp. AcE210 TaxID=2292703 RepID=UPI0010589D53|nr:hypothetical protein [Streptomyces sp. AcE210]
MSATDGGQVDWIHGAVYGAVGGALIEALVFNGRVLAWQAARRRARDAKRRKLPPLRAYVDPPADLAAAVSRLLLGALAGKRPPRPMNRLHLLV